MNEEISTRTRSRTNSMMARKKKKKKRTSILIIIIVSLLLIAAAVFFAFHYYYGLMNHLDWSDYTIDGILDSEGSSENDSSAEDIDALDDEITANIKANADELVYNHNVFNILLLGTDSREGGTSERSDAMIIVSINKETKQITMTSLLRDIYIYVPGVGNTRLNNANAYGGPELLMKTIQKNFGIRIDRCVQTNFFSFAEIVDAVGGVDIEVTADEIEYINEYVVEVNNLLGEDPDGDKLSASDAGLVHLNGQQALAYCRIRYIGMDFERTQRQRTVLLAIWNETKNLSVLKLNNLMTTVLPLVSTDLTSGECFSLLLSMADYKDYEIQTFRIPMDDTYEFLTIKGAEVIGIDFDENKDALLEMVYGE